MQLETLTPADDWDPEPGTEAAIDALAADDYTFHVWGGDWCIDCKQQLPAFGAALEYAGVADEQIEHYPVEKEEDGSKTGPGVEEYGIEYIPTVVVELDGEEVARFVESAPDPIAVALGNDLRSLSAADDAATGDD
ncbi:thioredoxin [Halonotius terrestris]|uniref:Thioredoxin n=1 Tax=Halonotius terrestris TaxID=2487750 RepID=A0A8J8TBP3_9EURY|nr:thioredoxin family protein [Halonotius terrestris]TQQ79227.1 thioredoxin [Halonotius terrestris]